MSLLNLLSIPQKLCYSQIFSKRQMLFILIMSITQLLLPTMICGGCGCSLSGVTGTHTLQLNQFTQIGYSVICTTCGSDSHCTTDASLSVTPIIPGMSLVWKQNGNGRTYYYYQGTPTQAGIYETTFTGTIKYYNQTTTAGSKGKKHYHTCTPAPISCTYIVSEPE